jgi:glucokinase
MMQDATPGLIADIGGTNARFSLVLPGVDEAQHSLTLPCADYPSLEAAAKAYLAAAAPAQAPRKGAFAIACPVLSDEVSFTNRDWTFSISALQKALELDHLDVAPIAILGPGTGLGVGVLVAGKEGWHAIPTEGGHVTLSAATEREAAIIGRLRPQFGHVSAERLLSGPGLVNLYQAIAQLDGVSPSEPAPHEVAKRAKEGDAVAKETLDCFFAMLGSFAGNLALSTGARGGVVIAGGVLQHLLEDFTRSSFRQRFEDKGRFKGYLQGIPVHVVTHPYPAFVGLRGLVS